MKSYYMRLFGAAIAMSVVLWGCQKEVVIDEAGAPTRQLSVPSGATQCSPSVTLNLAESDGNTVVDICTGTGNVIVPCGPGQSDWGTVTYSKYTTNFSDVFMTYDVQLAPGWFSDGYQLDVPYTGPIQPFGNFQSGFSVLNPLRYSFEVTAQLSSQYYGASCFDWAMHVSAKRLDIFGSVIPGTDVALYAYDPAGGESPFVIDDCYDGCPTPTTTQTTGNCSGCRAGVTATFTGCSQVDITSCKAIRQVVIVYSDCSREYHDNLTATSYSYSAPAGKSISHVFVRSGCRGGGVPASQDNIDTNGFNYNNIRRYQLNGNCFNASCN